MDNRDIECLIGERNRTHGGTEAFSCHWELMETIINTPNFYSLPRHQKAIISQLLHKIARLMCGDLNHIDHYDDIAGYSKLLQDSMSRRRGSL